MNDHIDTWLDDHQSELLGFLQRLVQTSSEVCPPDGGERDCQTIVAAAYRSAGAQLDVFTPDDVPGLRQHPMFYGSWDGMPRSFQDRPNVVGVFHGAGGGRSLLLSTHIDTVSRNPLPWSESSPFSGEIKAGRLYGRGSWDTKWGVAVSLYAVRCLHELGVHLRGDVILESVVDEEYGGGHGTLASRLRGYNADIAINCEPTSMVVAPSHRGGGEWRITLRGQAGLAFSGETLANPIYQLARVIEAVRAFDASRNAHPTPPAFFEDNPLLPAYIMQVGGGGNSYADVSGVPNECYLIAWVEEYPGTTQDEHTRHFTGFVNKFFSEDPAFKGSTPEYRPTIRYLPGSTIDPSHPFFSILEKSFRTSGLEYKLGGALFACDTYVFNKHSPTPALTLGPRGGNAHGADEYVLVEDVLNLTRVYARAILAWCG